MRSIAPPAARLKVMAMIAQPIVSSMIAEAMINCPNVASHEIHLAHDAGDDLHRGDGRRRAEKERRDEAPVGIGRERGRHRRADNRRRRAAVPPARSPPPGPRTLARVASFVSIPASSSHQQHAELRHCVQHRLLRGIAAEQRALRVRPHRAEHGGSEREAREQLPHDRGLADALHRLAEQAPKQHEQNDFGDEDRFGRSLPSAASAGTAARLNAAASQAARGTPIRRRLGRSRPIPAGTRTTPASASACAGHARRFSGRRSTSDTPSGPPKRRSRQPPARDGRVPAHRRRRHARRARSRSRLPAPRRRARRRAASALAGDRRPRPPRSPSLPFMTLLTPRNSAA